MRRFLFPKLQTHSISNRTRNFVSKRTHHLTVKIKTLTGLPSHSKSGQKCLLLIGKSRSITVIVFYFIVTPSRFLCYFIYRKKHTGLQKNKPINESDRRK